MNQEKVINPEVTTQTSLPATAIHRTIGLVRMYVPLIILAIIFITVTVLNITVLRNSDAFNTIIMINLVLLLCALFLIVNIGFNLQHQFLKPLLLLRDWTKKLHDGQLSARLPNIPNTDFSGLFIEINNIAINLQDLSEDMKTQVNKQTDFIKQKTQSLEIIYDVAASINAARDLDDLLTRFLSTLKNAVQARAAVVRLVSDDGNMRLVSSIGIDSEVIDKERILPSNTCICGTAYKNGHILYQDDVSICGQLIGMPFFENDNVTMIAIPLQYRDETLGVYNLFVEKESLVRAEGMDDLLTSIGRHLGMAIDKARLDNEAHRLSIMEERTSLAHELHDSLAQTLASLRFQVRVLDETLHLNDEAAVWQEMEKIENSLDEAYGELRELITHFRAPIDKRGLLPAIENLLDRFQNHTGIQTYLQREWDVTWLPAELEVQVLRIVQESLANIRKHSQAHTVRVILHSEPNGEYSILIEDDGIGFNNEDLELEFSDHIGLNIMDERALKINGTVRIESEAGEGTRVVLRFPHPNANNSKTESIAPIITTQI
ncbi:Nitrate/nitrite sensor protein [hydrothermal vent metagenome]|uniref:histidine kinase n=1 Tax=hydrothermal vent metagenome TaxID=652676 RepID=A0A3B1A646_9ZZZZ